MKTKFDLAYSLYSCREHKSYTPFNGGLDGVLREGCGGKSTEKNLLPALPPAPQKRYNSSMVKRFILAAVCVLLAGCSLFGGSKKTTKGNDLAVSGATGGVAALRWIDAGATTIAPRPSAAIGLYITAYLAQGIFLPVHSATLGIEAQKKLLAGQGNPVTDETFTLLQEFGNILQVDVSDVLNRSPDRRVALDQYLQAFNNIFVLSERKKTELDGAIETEKTDERAKREAVDQIEKFIRKSLDEEDYTGAGSRQRELGEAKGALAEITTKREQTEDIAGRYGDLLDIAKNRLLAIEANRLILIAGLQVIRLPGIENLDILLEQGKRRKTTSTIGTDYLK